MKEYNSDKIYNATEIFRKSIEESIGSKSKVVVSYCVHDSEDEEWNSGLSRTEGLSTMEVVGMVEFVKRTALDDMYQMN